MGHLHLVLQKVAALLGIAESGYRLVVNCGHDGGQEVPHLHFSSAWRTVVRLAARLIGDLLTTFRDKWLDLLYHKHLGLVSFSSIALGTHSRSASRSWQENQSLENENECRTKELYGRPWVIAAAAGVFLASPIALLAGWQLSSFEFFTAVLTTVLLVWLVATIYASAAPFAFEAC